MKRISLLIAFTIYLISSCSPKNTTSHLEADSMELSTEEILEKDSFIFPDDWLGYWKGDLEIYDVNGLKQIVPMSLDLAKTDTSDVFTWAIIYGQDSTAQRRDYQLKIINASEGHYLVDEQNGILLDAYHIHNELTSVFEVMDNTLITTYKRDRNDMIFTVNLFPSNAIRISGDTLIEGQEIPTVKSFQHKVHQTAILKKFVARPQH